MIIHHYYIRNGRICDTIVWKHRRENRKKHQEKKRMDCSESIHLQGDGERGLCF